MLPTDLKLLRELYDQHLFNIFCNLIKELPEVDFNCFLNNFGIFWFGFLKWIRHQHSVLERTNLVEN